MKAMLAWLGITGFNMKLLNARKKLAALRSPNGEPIPPFALGELYRDLERYGIIGKEIEEARVERLKAKPKQGNQSAGPDAGADHGSWHRDGGPVGA
jgi:hypothetical protein